jgi:hypothetical protein
MSYLHETGDQDLRYVFTTVCDTCGYPRLQDDKFKTLVIFIRKNFTNETTDTILAAYDQLALGNLDEKNEQHKSLTAMSFSQVMQSYRRNKTNKPGADEYLTSETGERVERYRLNPDARKILKERIGKDIYWADQVNEAESAILMEYYLTEARKQYEENGRMTAIIPQMFDYLQRDGRIKIYGGRVLKCYGMDETRVADLDDIEELAAMIMKEETFTSKNHNLFRGSKIFTTNIEDARKKAMIIKYFQS